MRSRTLAIGAAALATGILATTQSSAFAATTPASPYVAVGGPAVTIASRDTQPVFIGIGNKSDQPVDGAVVHIRSQVPVELVRGFSNCAYYINHATQGEYCSFTGTLDAGAVYDFEGFQVTLPPETESIGNLVLEVMSPADADSSGGILALAKKSAADGQASLGPNKNVAELVKTDVTIPANAGRVAFPQLILEGAPTKPTTTAPTTTAPTTTAATGTPTTTASSEAAPASTSPSPGGGTLPLTGSSAGTAATAGGALVVLGILGFVLTRRRRKTFSA